MEVLKKKQEVHKTLFQKELEEFHGRYENGERLTISFNKLHNRYQILHELYNDYGKLIEEECTVEELLEHEAQATILKDEMMGVELAYDEYEKKRREEGKSNVSVITEDWEDAADHENRRLQRDGEGDGGRANSRSGSQERCERFGSRSESQERCERSGGRSDRSRVQRRHEVTSQGFRLPNLDFEAFELSHKTWLAFWAQFRNIYLDETMDVSTKFQYLLMSIKPGQIKDHVQAYPRTDDNLIRVVDSLKDRFGDTNSLIELYTQELTRICTLREKVDMSSLYDKIEAQIGSLESLGKTREMMAQFVYPLVKNCLSMEQLKVWERNRPLNKAHPLKELMQFLEREARGEERLQLVSKSYNVPASAAVLTASVNEEKRRVKRTNGVQSGKEHEFKVTCFFCEKSHRPQDCVKAQKLSRDDLVVKIKASRVCFRCLQQGHRKLECRTFVRCMICEGEHLTLMCFKRSNGSVKKEAEAQKGNDRKNVVNFSGIKDQGPTYLKTLLVVLGNGNKVRKVRALLDDGAHRSYLAQEVAENLGLKSVRSEFISHGLFGGVDGATGEHQIYEAEVQGLNATKKVKMELVGQKTICSTLARPSVFRDPNLFKSLEERGVQLSDVGEDPPPIEMLLGADVLGKICTGAMQVLPQGITAVETMLGWSVFGCSSRRAKNLVSLSLSSFDADQVQKMWELEAIGINEPVIPPTGTKKEEDQNAQVHFENTIQREDDGRYVVQLPWKATHVPLKDNLGIASARLQSVTAKLKKEGNFEKYDEVFSQWLEEGIIEPVSNTELDSGRVHYLAHRPVIKMERNTKVRPVFDASAKSPGFASLNDCVYTGPNMLQQIPNLISKFRQGAYGLTGDIKQAFLQILVSKEDRDALRMLWWANGQIQVYRHNRVVFGISCSPFLLNATIAHHLEGEIIKESSVQLQEQMKKLQASFYVDDSVSSFEERQELDRFISTAKEVMLRGKFELRRWTSNAPWLKQEEDEVAVLGVKWNLKEDLLSCNSSVQKVNENVSKRQLLGMINSFYDPLGMLSPALLPAKIILQKSWKEKTGWDDPLPSELQKSYEAWAKTLHMTQEIQMPREICSGSYCKDSATLHVFSDASQTGYGCVIYLRHENSEEVSVRLVAAKSRVAPLQPTTIPRMELLGACVGVRLRKSLEGAFGPEIRTLYWTDSTTVLAWVTKALPWGTYVGNRVKEIRSGSRTEDWRFVPGIMNPSDVSSRGCTMEQLLKMKWWEGPNWLLEQPQNWPSNPIGECDEEALLELRSKKQCMVTVVKEEVDKFSTELTQYFSSYWSMIRMVAWMLRMCHKGKFTSTLSAQELEQAERKVLLVAQREGNCALKGVKTHQDEDGLLCVTSRVVNQGPLNSLVILPKNHAIVTSLIRFVHNKWGHAGVGTTLSKIREKYWIVNGRQEVRRVINSCVRCRKLTAPTCKTEPASLPKERTDVNAAAFQFTGADMFGPLYLRDGTKVWGILFTCAVYRGVRLDLVDSLSTESFVRALRRFLARNNCQELYTDQGTNFKGLSNLMMEFNWTEIEDFASSRRLRMSHTPPKAPWYGGFFERLVGVVKMCLFKQLEKASLTRDEMSTIFAECEQVVNSRPLTYLSEANDFRAITPAHFMQEMPGSATRVDLDALDEKSLVERVTYVASIRKELRERFVREYLVLLTQKPTKKGSQVKVGDVVLIEEAQKKRHLWPLGVVVELKPGKDNQCRVAKIKTGQSELIRPVQRLVNLEVSSQKLPSAPLSPGNTVNTQNTKIVTRAGRVVKPPARFQSS